MSILSKKKTSTLWILLVQGGSYSYKVELTFTIDQFFCADLFAGEMLLFRSIKAEIPGAGAARPAREFS